MTAEARTGPYDPCEWNPVKHEPAGHVGNVPVDGSCENNAELIVGRNGKWRLCRRCYEQDKRAHFQRYHFVRRIQWKGGTKMTAEARGRLNRWISEKRDDWRDRATNGCLMPDCDCDNYPTAAVPYDWAGDWRYAGKLLEDLEDGPEEYLFHRAEGDTLTEAIAVAWAKSK